MSEENNRFFKTIEDVAMGLRDELKEKDDKGDEKKNTLLFAYNSIGKTRLSVAFKDIGKQSSKKGDTLYFNAFTEDLFTWDNDLKNDSERALKLNPHSQFFEGLAELEVENRIRPFLELFADFDFNFDYDEKETKIIFSRKIDDPESEEDSVKNIKISRGEENLFIWCFFLAIVRLAIDGVSYKWVKYIYIDDPVSSLDENNAIAIAQHLAELVNGSDSLKCIISTHHALFFNVLCNTVGEKSRYFFSKSRVSDQYGLTSTGDTPFFYHVAMLKELRRVADLNELYTYHFNILRVILEKTASFHGYKKYTRYIKVADDGTDGVLHGRFLNVLSHGGHSLYEPQEMGQENKEIFKRILDHFLDEHDFNLNALPEVEVIQEKQDHD